MLQASWYSFRVLHLSLDIDRIGHQFVSYVSTWVPNSKFCQLPLSHSSSGGTALSPFLPRLLALNYIARPSSPTSFSFLYIFAHCTASDSSRFIRIASNSHKGMLSQHNKYLISRYHPRQPSAFIHNLPWPLASYSSSSVLFIAHQV